MARSFISVTQGAGTKLATNNYTDGADSKHDEIVVLGEQFLPTYGATRTSVSTATADSHLFQLMAGTSLKLRVRRILVRQVLNAGTVFTARLELWRLTTAGTGGTSTTPAPFESSDPACGATFMSLPTAKGTEGAILLADGIGLQAAHSNLPGVFAWEQPPNGKRRERVLMLEPENGAYSRRRIDELNDARVQALGRELGGLRNDVRDLDSKVDKLSNRLAWIAGGIAVLSLLANIIGPVLVRELIQ
jgi:hypothetical protein